MQYTSRELIDYAISLADLSNSNFLNYGDITRSLNIAYKKLYNDLIKAGDLTYVKSVGLHDGIYELPSDFYQLASIHYDGVELHQLPLDKTESDTGYIIKNNTIEVQRAGSVVMDYYPLPPTITYKKDPVLINAGPFRTGFGTKAVTTGNIVYDLSTKISQSCSAYILGFNSGLNSSYTSEINYSGGVIRTSPTGFWMTSKGVFIPASRTCTVGYCSDDGNNAFYALGGYWYYIEHKDDSSIKKVGPTNGVQGRYLYWNGKHSLMTIDGIYTEDGEFTSTDSVNVQVLLKADTNTGYGYITQKGSNYYLEGCWPDTLLNFPNPALFEIMAFYMAIQFRKKQNADVSLLQDSYRELVVSYFDTINRDDSYYPTIKNYASNRWYR